MRLIPPIGTLPRTFWYLWFGMLINRLGGFLYLILPYYLPGEHRFTVEQVAWVASLHNIGAIFAGPIGGSLAEILGRKKALLLTTFLGALAMLQLGLASAPLHISVAAFMLGFFGNLYRPASQAMVADLVPAKDRVNAYGWMYWAANLGFAGAAMIAGWVGKKSYMTLFVLDAATTLLFGILIFILVPKPTSEPMPSSPTQKKKDLFLPYLDWVFLSFLGIQFLIDFLYHQADVALPSDMRNHGHSPERFGSVIALNGILIILIQPFLIQLLRRAKRAWVLSVGSLLIGIGFGCTAFANGIPWYAISVIIWTLGEITAFSMVPSLISDFASSRSPGSYQGAYQFSIALSACAAPPLGVYLSEHYGRNGLWLACVGIGTVAAILHLVIAPARKRKLIQLYGEKEADKREDGIG